MKSWLILIVVAVAALLAATAALPLLGDNSTGRPPQFAAPVLTTDNVADLAIDSDPVYDFGVMAHSLTVQGRHTWTFRNKGKAPLKLTNDKTTCSCTVLQLGKDGSAKTILPGESLAIDVTWIPKFAGDYKQTATIGTNDPRQPKIDLSIEGKVYPAINIVPPNDNGLSFGTVGNEADITRSIVLYSKDRPDLKITKVTSSVPDRITVAFRPATKAETNGESATGQAIDVTLKANDKLGAIPPCELLILTDHPNKPDLKVKVTGQVAGPISFIPGRVEVRNPTTSDGGSTVNQVWVRGRSAVHFTMASAPPGVSVEFEAMPPRPGVSGAALKMTTRIAPGTPAGEVRGSIVLRTDIPHAAEVRIPVEALVQEKH